MHQHAQTLAIRTPGSGLFDITSKVEAVVSQSAITNGLATLFIRHTSASLTIQENADPDVLVDLKNFFERIAPFTDTYQHATEGPDDMPAHIKSALTATSLSIPISAGRMALGTWQGIYVFEHRTRAHDRDVVVHVMGEKWQRR
ncbi:secondary thiamine-phosphate synthase enzyme YjbQ [Pyruvatibacter sp.]|uniref:secondary thiamine-phosphate synthase enzyme YjbQ n=1 Tax=Pyruvatibacter sp. TaxID=1981328 RepID=UPI003263003A